MTLYSLFSGIPGPQKLSTSSFAASWKSYLLTILYQQFASSLCPDVHQINDRWAGSVYSAQSHLHPWADVGYFREQEG